MSHIILTLVDYRCSPSGNHEGQTMSAILSNPMTGETKVIPMGFSWTTLFFGFFPALFRADFKWAAIMTVAWICTFSLSQLVFPFMYNKLYFNDLLKKGFRPNVAGSGFGGQQVVQQFHINAGNTSSQPHSVEPIPQALRLPMAPRASQRQGVSTSC
jgi:hypothetical protein